MVSERAIDRTALSIVIFLFAFAVGIAGGMAFSATGSERDAHNVRRDFDAYRDRVDLCATTAESGETLRACIEEAGDQW